MTDFSFADGILFFIPILTFLAICYFLFRFLYDKGSR